MQRYLGHFTIYFLRHNMGGAQTRCLWYYSRNSVMSHIFYNKKQAGNLLILFAQEHMGKNSDQVIRSQQLLMKSIACILSFAVSMQSGPQLSRHRLLATQPCREQVTATPRWPGGRTSEQWPEQCHTDVCRGLNAAVNHPVLVSENFLSIPRNRNQLWSLQQKEDLL